MINISNLVGCGVVCFAAFSIWLQNRYDCDPWCPNRPTSTSEPIIYNWGYNQWACVFASILGSILLQAFCPREVFQLKWGQNCSQTALFFQKYERLQRGFTTVFQFSGLYPSHSLYKSEQMIWVRFEGHDHNRGLEKSSQLTTAWLNNPSSPKLQFVSH